MALSLSQTKALAEVLKPGMRICSLGYPDLIAPMSMILEFGKFNLLKYRDDSEAICKRHGLSQRRILDSEYFLEALGCKLDVYDIVQERGCEILCDLNLPFDGNTGNEFHKHVGLSPMWEKYDIVLDVGTVEHVINIWQALVNMAGMVKQGGYIIHENPHSGWGNHGFYSLHPTLFNDFYSANGFSIEQCLLVARNGETQTAPSMTKRFSQQGAADLNVFCMAQRTKIQSFVYPVQSKYAKLIPAAVVRAKETVHG